MPLVSPVSVYDGPDGRADEHAAAVDLVAGHADVVRRRRPGERRRSRARGADEARRRARSGGVRDDRRDGRRRDGARLRGRVARPVDRRHLVAVRGAVRQARVDVVRRRRGRDEHAAAVDLVAGHRDVVGRRRPRQRDLRVTRRRGQAGRHGRRRRVRRRRRDRRRLRRGVPRGVDRGDLVAVGGAVREAGVGVARPGGRGDQDAAAVDAVAGDADVVGRGRPRQRDLRAARGRGQARRHARRRGVGRRDGRRGCRGRLRRGVRGAVDGRHLVAVGGPVREARCRCSTGVAGEAISTPPR